jgi:hypothetical protein
MRISIERDRNTRMAKPLGNDFDILTSEQQQRRMSVAEIMETEPSEKFTECSINRPAPAPRGAGLILY